VPWRLALVAILSLARPAQALPGLSARELAELCDAGLASPASPKTAPARQACTAYLDAVAGTVSQLAYLPDNTQTSDNAVMPGPAQKPALFCVPEDEPLATLVKSYAAWLAKHPASADRVAAPVVIAAFAAAYPCR